jgi:hypothetical protein
MQTVVGSRRISNRVCSKSGHKIIAVQTNSTFEPTTKILVPKFWHGCEKCGMTVDELRNYRGYTQEKKENATAGN